MSFVTLTFVEPDGTRVEVQTHENYSLMEIAVAEGISGIEGACGGALACATCHCVIDHDWSERAKLGENEQSEEELDLLDCAIGREEGSRLGCQVNITHALDGLIVHIPKV